MENVEAVSTDIKKDVNEINERKNKTPYDKALILVLVLAFILRIWVFTKTYNQAIWWDGADYMATAKNWAGINHNLIDTWYYRRGVLMPLVGMIFFKIGFGEIGIRLLIVLLSLGIVLVSYFLISSMFNKQLGLMVSICVAGSWVFLFFTGRILTDLPAAFLFLLSILFFWKGYVLKEGDKYLYLFAVCFTFTVMTRMQSLMFIFPIFIFIFLTEKFKLFTNKKLWICAGIFILIMIPQGVMHYQHFGNPVADLAKYYLGVGSSEKQEVGVSLAKVSDLFLYFTNLPYIFDANEKGYNNMWVLSPLYFLFLIGFFYLFLDMFLGIDKIFKNTEIRKKFFVFIFIVIIFLFLGYISQTEQRYVMQSIPFLFLIAVSPIPWFADLISKNNNGLIRGGILFLIFGIILYLINMLGIIPKIWFIILALCFPIFLLYDLSLKPKTVKIILIICLVLVMIPNLIFANNLIESKKTSYMEVKQAGEWLKERTAPEDIIIGVSFIQIVYYSERSTYPFHLGYRRDLPRANETGMYNFIMEKRPKYYIISLYEKDPQWAWEFPEKHKDLLTPVQAYTLNGQPIVIIYQFNYSKLK
jgi:4-amino-4-deoxy-L-arabinose transferase-like glycosyltransferase